VPKPYSDVFEKLKPLLSLEDQKKTASKEQQRIQRAFKFLNKAKKTDHDGPFSSLP
jgi:hypothetical protein